MASVELGVAPRLKAQTEETLPSGDGSVVVNVGEMERLGSAIGGGGLIALGLRRGGVSGLAAVALGGGLLHRGLTGHCHMYQLLGRNSARPRHNARVAVPAQQGVKVEKCITINRPTDEVYDFWRKLDNLPRFMSHLKSVTTTGGTRSHWVAQGPLGASVEWDAEIHNERPNELIAWRSLPGGDVATAGSVHFVAAPGDRGTEVRVSLKYDPPGGKLGAVVAKLFGEEPQQQIQDDLRRLKQFLEAGEIPTTHGQSKGVCS